MKAGGSKMFDTVSFYGAMLASCASSKAGNTMKCPSMRQWSTVLLSFTQCSLNLPSPSVQGRPLASAGSNLCYRWISESWRHLNAMVPCHLANFVQCYGARQ